jgi:16S rRNA G1207 methylase RsmC
MYVRENVPTFKKLSIYMGLMDHYFSPKQTANHDVATIMEHIGLHTFTFRTDAGVFSKGQVDKGTLLLLSAIPPQGSSKVLDLGCGWGAIGIVIAKHNPHADVHLVDVNQRAISLARSNAKKNGVSVTVHLSDGLTESAEMFDTIATNPPIRAGKDVVYRLMRESWEHLHTRGSFYAVIRTKQGAKSYHDELERVFGSAEIVERQSGYKVFRAVRT